MCDFVSLVNRFRCPDNTSKQTVKNTDAAYTTKWGKEQATAATKKKNKIRRRRRRETHSADFLLLLICRSTIVIVNLWTSPNRHYCGTDCFEFWSAILRAQQSIVEFYTVRVSQKHLFYSFNSWLFGVLESFVGLVSVCVLHWQSPSIRSGCVEYWIKLVENFYKSQGLQVAPMCNLRLNCLVTTFHDKNSSIRSISNFMSILFIK